MRNYKVVPTERHAFKAMFPYQLAERTFIFFWKRLDTYWSSKEDAQRYCDEMDGLKEKANGEIS